MTVANVCNGFSVSEDHPVLSSVVLTEIGGQIEGGIVVIAGWFCIPLPSVGGNLSDGLQWD